MKLTKPMLLATAGILVAAAIGLAIATPQEKSTVPNGQLISAMDQLYIATGRDITEEVNAADTPILIGKIAVSIPSDWRPTSNMQANFEATGAEVIAHNGALAVNIDGKWMEFINAAYRISYQDDISQILAYIPNDWTYELIHAEDNYEAELLSGVDTSDTPDVGLRIFLEGRQDSVIEVLRCADPAPDQELLGIRYLEDADIKISNSNNRTRTIITRSTADNYVIHSDLDKDVFSANNDDLYSFRTSVMIIDDYLPNAALIKEISADSITVDPIEFITRDDTERITALGLTKQDMIAGYYIHNPDTDTVTWQLTPLTTYTFIDWHNNYVKFGQNRTFSTTDSTIFRQYLQGYGPEPKLPFFFTVENGIVTNILERPLA